ncbi:hypothetical protein QAD02_007937 [Eretmocerus hayati]|uniref:Uncharacterized protein n=1 Tax=Eretmocerus hayati TaxID=131215 RepID=A0ACC2N516_9HYME|nr:hypothetical protein QAD02_007937 [Eretmocerus hayati]
MKLLCTSRAGSCSELYRVETMSNPESLFNDLANDASAPEYIRKLGAAMAISQTSLQSQLTSINTQLTDVSSSQIEQTRAISSLRADFTAARVQVDPCEVRFSGIPKAVQLDDRATILEILTTMNCAESVGTILSVRRWGKPDKQTAAVTLNTG